MNINKYYPSDVSTSIYEISFQKLKENNKTILFFDIDNTLLTYQENEPSERLIDLFKNLKKEGFVLGLVSNNDFKRVEKIGALLNCNYILAKMNKPSKRKFNQFIIDNKLEKEKIIVIGDQLLTDILCANRTNVDSILVKSLDRSTEHWYTTINRLREKTILKRIKKTNIELYQKINNIVEDK